MSGIRVSHDDTQGQLDGLGEISDGVEIPKDFIGADGSFEAPSVESILEALDTMPGLSLEDKEGLRLQLLAQQRGAVSMNEDGSFSWGAPSGGSFLGNQTILLFSLLCIIALIFVYFTLKLYRSLMEKERKKEEKRKMKMQKKKK